MSLVDALYNQGVEKLALEHDTKEAAKVGTLRGGSVGMLLYGKTPVGNCARKAYLRFKGIPDGEDKGTRHLMFEGGLANEDIWANILEKSLPEGHKLLREEEFPLVWEMPNGTKITGRPDLLITKDGAPLVGIELKSVSAIWTAKDVVEKPKLVHCLQSGLYSRLAGVPWELWYTSRVDFAVAKDSFTQNLFSKFPKEWVETKEDWKDKTAKIHKILPFRFGWKLEWRDDQLWYSSVATGEWKPSTITWSAILAYYGAISNVDVAKVLPPRPANVDIDGKQAGYKLCDYCHLKEQCDTHETSLKNWLSSVLSL